MMDPLDKAEMMV